MQNDLKNASEVLKKGGLILFPADTFWGIGCDATNVQAVDKIFQIKGSKDPASLLVLMENPALLERYVKEVPEIAWDLVEISTTPLTIIFPEGKNLASGLYTEDGSIGIRFTKEAFTSQLLQRFRRPLAATTATFSGCNVPVSFDEVAEEIRLQADYVVQYNQTILLPDIPYDVIKLWPGGRIEILKK